MRFRRARRDEHAIGRDREAAAGELGRHRFARRRDARRRAVAVVAVAHGALDGGDQVRRRLEPERVGVADVQIAHAAAGGLDALRLSHDVADGVAEAVDAARDGDGQTTIYSVRGGHVATIQRSSRLSTCRVVLTGPFCPLRSAPDRSSDR